MSTGAPIEKGTPIRYPSTALLCVNSADSDVYNATGFRVSSTAPARIFINNMRPMVVGYMTRVALTEVNIQWDTPNVNESNNTLTLELFNASGVSQGFARIQVSSGFYTAPLLGFAVASALNANAAITAVLGASTFSVLFGGLPCGTNLAFAGTTKNAVGSYFVITSSSTTGFFRLVPGTKSNGSLPALVDDLTNMMGLTPTIASGALNYYTTITGGFASMQYSPYIDVVSDLLTKNQNVTDGVSSKVSRGGGILARIYFSPLEYTPRDVTITYAPTSGNFGSSTDNAVGSSPFTCLRQFAVPKQIQWNTTENIDLLDIQIQDYLGNPVVYQPIAQQVGDEMVFAGTADIQMTFQVTEV
jgi:hypothetical protein